MNTLLIRIKASKNGEPYRDIAKGTRNRDGRIELPEGSEDVPRELLDAFHRYLEETQLSYGTWDHRVADVRYQIGFTKP
jgi:hypothetical protein